MPIIIWTRFISSLTLTDPMQMEWTEKFKQWLEQGEEGAEKLLEYPWDVEVKQIEGDTPKDLIIASHPKIPFNIEVVVGTHFANLVINPVIPTDAMDSTERMRIYKKLLHLNTDLNLMKAGLIGYDDNPVIQVDLDLESLNEDEFNDALTLVIVGAHNMIKILGLADEMQEFMLQRYKALVAQKVQDGETKDKIMDFLVNRGGLDKGSAQTIVDLTMKEMTKAVEEPENKDDESGPGPMYG
jgi:hypothetical protein